MTLRPSIDVLGLGVTSVDDLLVVDRFPQPDVKMPVRATDRQCGGLTATALVAAARLGARCAYAGQLGDDELSTFVRQTLEQEGIDTSPVVLRRSAAPVHSIIIVGREGQTRNIFYRVPTRCGADEHLPGASSIRRCRVLFVDHYGVVGNLRAMAIAHAAGIPIVADVEGGGSDATLAEFIGQVDHLIVSQGFAREITGKDDPAEALAALAARRRDVTAITCGERGCWWTERSGPPMHHPAFAVKVADTTGCGDVFHGAYAAALAEAMPAEKRIRLASAAAALKATQLGGQRGIPNRRQVDEFLRHRPAG